MDLVKYIKDKFTPSRPMGRKNWFWSNIFYAIIYIPCAFVLPGMDQLPAPAPTVLMLSLIGAPFVLLHCRRAYAAGIPLILVLVSWFLTPVNLMTEGGFIESAINWYQGALFIFLLVIKNKVEPVSP